MWAVWKSRNKNALHNQDVETREVLEDLITDLVRKRWNATRFMEGGRRLIRQRELRALWADNRFDGKYMKLFPSSSLYIYFYGRITYIVPVAQPHRMKPVPECTETGLQPCTCPIPGNHRETSNRTYYDEHTDIPTRFAEFDLKTGPTVDFR